MTGVQLTKSPAASQRLAPERAAAAWRAALDERSSGAGRRQSRELQGRRKGLVALTWLAAAAVAFGVAASHLLDGEDGMVTPRLADAIADAKRAAVSGGER